MSPPLESEKEYPPTFLTDQMLGGLTKVLRMLGFDTIYWRGEGDKIVDLARKSGRIILTRRKGLLKYSDLARIFLISCDNTWDQLNDLLEEFPSIIHAINPLSRCLCCNGVIIPVKKEEIEDRVPDHIYQTQMEFSTCSNCKKVYWKGTHREKMEATIKRLREKWMIRSRTLKDPL